MVQGIFAHSRERSCRSNRTAEEHFEFVRKRFESERTDSKTVHTCCRKGFEQKHQKYMVTIRFADLTVVARR